MAYGYGRTDVRTSAAEALSKGTGVCQDYAHVMLAICRTLGIPCLYVSGHLLAAGGTHAWVEVLVPSEDDPGTATAWAFDPTHGRPIRPDYVSIAAGRDYSDVAPTSGSFEASAPGKLSTRKQIRLLEVEYA